MLRVVEKDAGILLALLPPEQVLSWLDRCLPEVLERHPLAMLVLMRSMFNWRRIPEMLRLKEQLLAAIDARPICPGRSGATCGASATSS